MIRGRDLRAALLELETPEGVEEFVLSVVADSEDEARRQTETWYRELRGRAGLSADEAELLYLAPPWRGKPCRTAESSTKQEPPATTRARPWRCTRTGSI